MVKVYSKKLVDQNVSIINLLKAMTEKIDSFLKNLPAEVRQVLIIISGFF